MRRTLLPLGILLVVAIGLIVWLRARSDDTTTAKTATAQTASGKRMTGPRAPAKPATVSGKVTRKADGSGVGGAVVALAWAELGADFSGPKRPTIIAVADDQGAWIAKDVPPGDYMAAATGKGLLPSAREKLVIASAEQRTGIDFVLEAGGQPVRGTVSDVLGGPIAGARVVAKKRSWSIAQDAELVTLTGADGAYELTLQDGDYSMAAAHDDYTRDTESIKVDGKPVTVDFKLIPGGVMRGKVIARGSGEPVPGAFVTAEPARRSFEDRHTNAVADANGEFMLRGLRSGTIEVEAKARGFASAQPTTVQIGVGEEVDDVIVMVDGAFSISGRVVKKGTKDGIAGARVGAFSMGGSQAEAPDPTDADGVFEVVGVKPGSYMMYAAAEDAMLEIGKPVEVSNKDVTDVIVELSTGVVLSGRVDPAAIASVQLELEGEFSISNMFEMVKAMMCRTESDAAGAFKLEHVPNGKFKIKAATRDGTTGTLPVTVAGVEQAGLVVPIKPRASIAGRVIDTSGKPVAGVDVVARSDDKNPMQISFNGIRDNVETAPDGSFKIVGLEPGKYDVRTRTRQDFADMARLTDKDKKKTIVELAEGQQKTGVVLTVEAHDGVIRGVVLGTDKKPAADSWVTARIEREPIKGMPEDMQRFAWLEETEPVLTNADGRFTITKLKKGKYTLVAEGPRGSSRGETKSVNTGDSTTIQLASLGTLVVAVTQQGKPVAKYDIDCDGPSADVARHAEAADGVYTIDHLAPGDYKCTVKADAGTAEGKIAVPSGEVKLPLSLELWGSLTGVVVSVLTGKPLPGLVAVASGATQSGMIEALTGKGARTDANGRFVVEKVANGKGRLMLMPQEQAMTTMESHPYEIKAGQRLDMGTIKIVPPRTGEAGTYGITAEPVGISLGDAGITGDKLEVKNVKEGGPAAAAGVVVGDKITALEGRSIKELTPITASKLISSGTPAVGDTVRVTLERGPTVTLTAVKW